MTYDPVTIGDLKNFIKDMPDDMPVYLDDDHDIMSVLSMNQKEVAIFNCDLDDDIEITALVLGIS